MFVSEILIFLGIYLCIEVFYTLATGHNIPKQLDNTNDNSITYRNKL